MPITTAPQYALTAQHKYVTDIELHLYSDEIYKLSEHQVAVKLLLVKANDLFDAGENTTDLIAVKVQVSQQREDAMFCDSKRDACDLAMELAATSDGTYFGVLELRPNESPRSIMGVHFPMRT